MKAIKLIRENLLTLGMVSIMLILVGCTKNPEIKPALPLNLSAALPDEKITEEEKASLKYMVEEEKLAMDVYDEMFKLYGLKIFDNINQSEIRHVEAISNLIEKYGLENPIDDNLPGEFENEEIQQLYGDLIELGKSSKLQAINVGLIIEKKDIKDIQTYLDLIDEQKDIELVYENLLNGSINHLEAFLKEVDNQ